MPYVPQTPDTDLGAVYDIPIQHKVHMSFFGSVTFRPDSQDGLTESQRDQLAQDFVDLIAHSDDWQLGEVNFGSKGYSCGEQITPTS